MFLVLRPRIHNGLDVHLISLKSGSYLVAISVLALGLGGVACVAATSLFYGEKGGGVLLGCLPCGSCHPSRDAEPDAARLKLWAQRGVGSPVLDTTNSPDDVSDGKASGCPVGPECSSRPGRPQRHDPQEKRNSSR